MNKKFLSILLLSTVALVNADTPAKDAAVVAPKHNETAKQQIKVGVVSATDIMMGTDAGKEANARIDAKRVSSMGELEKDAKVIRDAEEKLRAKASTMSAESQRAEATKIEQNKQDLELKNKKFMQDLQLAAQTEMEKLGQEFDEAVRLVAKESKVDLMFEKESGRIIFAADNLNVTESVKVAMNTGHKATQVASAAKAPAKANA